jgi:hypothetical protein
MSERPPVNRNALNAQVLAWMLRLIELGHYAKEAK